MLVDNVDRRVASEKTMLVREIAVAIAKKVYRGSYLVKGAAGTVYAWDGVVGAGILPVGFAREFLDNSTGVAASAVTLPIEYGHLEQVTVTGATAANVGYEVHASDDNTFQIGAGLNTVLVGIMHQYLSATKHMVLVRPE